MNKRTLLSLAPVALLSACGFRLRGVPEFGFGSLYIVAPASSPLARELQRTLDGSGRLESMQSWIASKVSRAAAGTAMSVTKAARSIPRIMQFPRRPEPLRRLGYTVRQVAKT